MYLAEGRSQAAALVEQEQQLVSSYGDAVVQEAREFQESQTLGRAKLQTLQREGAMVHWIRQRAEEAFTREHIACQTLRVDLAQIHMTCVHHEQHAQHMEARAKQLLDQRNSARESCVAAELDA